MVDIDLSEHSTLEKNPKDTYPPTDSLKTMRGLPLLQIIVFELHFVSNQSGRRHSKQSENDSTVSCPEKQTCTPPQKGNEYKVLRSAAELLLWA